MPKPLETYSIAWHRMCLENSKSYLEVEKKALEEQTIKVNRITSEIAVLEFQIRQAERRELTHFNPEKFLIKRKEEE